MYYSIQAHNPYYSNPSKKGNKAAANSSSAPLIDYLDKENFEQVEKGDYRFLTYKENGFFNNSGAYSRDYVVQKLDDNKGKLKKDESRFYHLIVSPSKYELEHIDKASDFYIIELMKNGALEASAKELKEDIKEAYLQNYINDVMESYANNFEQKNHNGKPFTSDDLVWFAKMEKKRNYSYHNKSVQFNNRVKRQISDLKKELESEKISKIKFDEEKAKLDKQLLRTPSGNVIKEGVAKEGDQTHFHIVVSRLDGVNDREHKVSLSPISKAKKSEHKFTNYFQKNEKEIDGKIKSFWSIIPKSQAEDLLKNNGMDPSNVSREELEAVGLKKYEYSKSSGFNRNEFANSIEDKFDKKFSYDRALEEKFEYKKQAKQHNAIVNYAKNSSKHHLTHAVNSKAKEALLGDFAHNIYLSKDLKASVMMSAKLQVQKAIGQNPFLELVPLSIPKSKHELAIKLIKMPYKFTKAALQIKGGGLSY